MAISLTTEREKEVLNETITIIKEFLNPEKIYIFGSRVKGTSFYYSDFDIGIEANTPKIMELEKLRETIDTISGLYSLDIIFLKDVEPDFADMVRKTGVVIYER
jgi:predicted nucleotidyltransferase